MAVGNTLDARIVLQRDGTGAEWWIVETRPTGAGGEWRPSLDWKNGALREPRRYQSRDEAVAAARDTQATYARLCITTVLVEALPPVPQAAAVAEAEAL